MIDDKTISRFVFGPANGCNGPMNYSASQRKRIHDEFKKAFHNNDKMLYLESHLSATKVPVLMDIRSRSVRLHCFFPRTSSYSLSFSLKDIGSYEETDALVQDIKTYYDSRKKFACSIKAER